jgi:hypothetical protein
MVVQPGLPAARASESDELTVRYRAMWERYPNDFLAHSGERCSRANGGCPGREAVEGGDPFRMCCAQVRAARVEGTVALGHEPPGTGRRLGGWAAPTVLRSEETRPVSGQLTHLCRSVRFAGDTQVVGAAVVHSSHRVPFPPARQADKVAGRCQPRRWSDGVTLSRSHRRVSGPGSRGVGEGQGEPEDASPSDRAVDPDPSAVGRDDRLADVQPQPQAAT